MQIRKPSTIVFIGLMSFMAHSLTSCKTNEKKVELTKESRLKPPNDYTPAQQEQLTFSGENFDPNISPNSQKILYVSKNRGRHSHSQIYELTLTTKKDRRVTFQDGEVRNPVYHPNQQQFFYASTTDEIKENPLFLINSLDEIKSSHEDSQQRRDISSSHIMMGSELLPFEIYSSYLNGNHIKRLTHSANFDAEPSLTPDGQQVIFASVRNKNMDLFLMHENGTETRPLTQTKTYEDEPRLSPNGEMLAWVQYGKGGNNSQIMIGDREAQNARPLLTRVAQTWSPRWHPEGQKLLFSSNIDDEDNFELYVANLDGTCLQRLTYTAANEIQADFSSDGKFLVFTSNATGSNQIYRMEFVPPTSCPESQK